MFRELGWQDEAGQSARNIQDWFAHASAEDQEIVRQALAEAHNQA